MKKFVQEYFSYIYSLLEGMDLNQISAFVEELENAREKQKTVFFIGNGGSAATASHMANDFGTISLKKGLEKPLRATALTDNVALITCIANDSCYESLFTDQLRIYYQPGDVLVAISASGNSENIINAAKWVKSKGGRVTGLLGFDGGELKNYCDVAILVKTPKGEYGPVEDIHMILDHLISTWLQEKMV
ncbi:MAG: SIS domain-containing protein [Actinomycetia bacterium]|nr:SIS domain-containing protein [Actinomycetes bacterium]